MIHLLIHPYVPSFTHTICPETIIDFVTYFHFLIVAPSSSSQQDDDNYDDDEDEDQISISQESHSQTNEIEIKDQPVEESMEVGVANENIPLIPTIVSSASVQIPQIPVPIIQEPKPSEFQFESQTQLQSVNNQTLGNTQINYEANEDNQPGMFPLIPGNMTREELYKKVKEHFPTFTPNGILRFSSLLGPGRPSCLPKIWQDCKKPTRKQKRPEDVVNPDDWTFNFGPIPGPEMLDDQEERFLTPIDVKKERQRETERVVVVDDETREWRFGPAQYWYDMYNVPEDGQGFNYGFKLKVR